MSHTGPCPRCGGVHGSADDCPADTVPGKWDPDELRGIAPYEKFGARAREEFPDVVHMFEDMDLLEQYLTDEDDDEDRERRTHSR